MSYERTPIKVKTKDLTFHVNDPKFDHMGASFGAKLGDMKITVGEGRAGFDIIVRLPVRGFKEHNEFRYLAAEYLEAELSKLVTALKDVRSTPSLEHLFRDPAKPK